VAPALLYRTLGPTLPEGAATAAGLWGAAQLCARRSPDAVRRAGIEGNDFELGDKLFDAIMASPSGLIFAVDTPAEAWSRMGTSGGKINLAIPEMLGELERLAGEAPPARDPEFPLVLSAGERRSFTANTIYRDPAWRKKDGQGALRINPDDAERMGIVNGGRARLTTKRDSVEVSVEVTAAMLPGHISLPNGLGLDYPDAEGRPTLTGVPPNELTTTEDRDWLAGTPWHKHVPARVEAMR
jgi:anaerobic selenocysteine-containing dehydrogenase